MTKQQSKDIIECLTNPNETMKSKKYILDMYLDDNNIKEFLLNTLKFLCNVADYTKGVKIALQESIKEYVEEK